MDTKTLQGLSKDELIKIIEELQLKEALHAKGIQGPEVDYRYLVESASDIIFILDEQGNLVYCNKAWVASSPWEKDISWVGKSPGMMTVNARMSMTQTITSGCSIPAQWAALLWINAFPSPKTSLLHWV